MPYKKHPQSQWWGSKAIVLLLFSLIFCAQTCIGSKSIPSSLTLQKKGLVKKQPRSTPFVANRASAKPVPKDVTKSKATTEIFRGGASGGTDLKTMGGWVYFIALDIILRKIFVEQGITFPSMMAGSVLLFVTMVLAELARPGLGDAAFDLLSPGAGFLAKWLPSFFVPGLAMLPLAPKIGSGIEIAKVIFIIIAGFYFTTSTTAFATIAIRSMQGQVEATPPPAPEKSTPAAAPAARVKPFSEEFVRNLAVGATLFGALSLYLDKAASEYLAPVRTIFMVCASIASYTFGANLPPSLTKILHPTLTSTIGVWAVTYLYSKLSGSSFLDALKTYKVGSFDPQKTGAGDLILHMLGPSVCSLSVAMYSRKKLMTENLLAVTTAALVSAVGGLFGTAIAVRLLNVASEVVRLSILSRNVTTALSMAIAEILGGNISIAATIVVVTGIFGATVGRGFLDSVGIKDPISRGLAMGAGAQGLGVASMVPEPDAFPFSAMTMILTALLATTLASIPAVKDVLKNLALGTA